VEGMGLTGHVLGSMAAVACTVSSPVMALRLVAAGLGLTIIPSSLASPLLGTAFVPFDKSQANLDVAIIWSSKRQDGGAFRATLHNFLSQIMGNCAGSVM
jgi:DNA-binding transcriptional LysR family regulator